MVYKSLYMYYGPVQFRYLLSAQRNPKCMGLYDEHTNSKEAAFYYGIRLIWLQVFEIFI